MPVDLHAVPQLHPQLGLLLRGHGLPALLNTGECGIRDGMLGGGAGLLGSDRLLLSLRTSVQASHWARNGAVGAQARGGHSRAASSSASNGTKEHCVLRVCARIRINRSPKSSSPAARGPIRRNSRWEIPGVEWRGVPRVAMGDEDDVRLVV